MDKKPITGRYFVNSLEGIEEQADEEMTTMKTGPVDVIDEVTMDDVERLEGEGSTVVSPAAVEKMEGSEKSKWLDGMKDEMNSMDVREVFDEVTATGLNERYWRKGIKTNKIPAKMVMVKKPLHDGAGGWKARARVVCCGNFEPGSVGKDVGNRAEVPSTFEMRTLLALGVDKGWSIGSLDVKTAFLYAELDEEEDGIIVVQPPSILVRLGLVRPGVLWKLKKALYGLRCAPKRWGEERDRTLANQEVSTEAPQRGAPGGAVQEKAQLHQCKAAKGIWKIKMEGTIVGYILVYVDDVMITARTVWIEAVFRAFQSNWECNIIGIMKRDGEETGKAIPQTVFLSITIEQVKEGRFLRQKEYLESKLKVRDIKFGRPNLPEVEEGKEEPIPT